MLVQKFLKVKLPGSQQREFGRKNKKKTVMKNIVIPPEYDPIFALNMIRIHNFAFFDQSLDLFLHLNIDARRTEQTIRGSCVMPAGLGKSEKICFFCTEEENQELARKCGVDIIGNETTLDEIKKEEINFDKLYATVSGVQQLKPYARILGPRNLFPNTKVRTQLKKNEIEEVLKEAKQGKLDFRTDPSAHIKVSIGKLSFSDENLFTNLSCFMEKVNEIRPEAIKGALFKKILLKPTLGKAWRVSIPHVDPNSKEYILKR